MQLGTSIAVAFARSPMTLAVQANDLQTITGGRFTLGLGSQIKPHIERRFSMPWSQPAARMRELIAALRAIWEAWDQGSKLDFRGDFYTHTLMTPMFDPGPNPHGPPKVLLAAVGQHMTRVAAEVADGIMVHGFTTERHYREVAEPVVLQGLEASGRARGDFEVFLPSFVVTGADEVQMAEAAKRVRQQIAFYGSTPAYRGVLEVHGWGTLQDELHRLSKAGEWERMGEAIDDEVLDAFAVVSEPEHLAERLRSRWGGIVDRLTFYTPYEADQAVLRTVVAELRAEPAPREVPA